MFKNIFISKKKENKDLNVSKTNVTNLNLTSNKLKMAHFFEDYGKTALAVITVVTILVVALSGVIKGKDKSVTPKSSQTSQNDLNPQLENDLAYAGFKADFNNSDLGLKARVQTSDLNHDKIQIFNENVMIDVESFTFKPPKEDRGSGATTLDKIEEKNINLAEYVTVKEKKLSLSSLIKDVDNRQIKYKLIDTLDTIKTQSQSPDGKTNEVTLISYQYKILAPVAMTKGQFSRSEISINFKDEGQSQEAINQTLEKLKPVIASLDRVDKKEVFIDSSTRTDIDKVFSDNKNKFKQSDLLKYNIYIPDGYTMTSDKSVDKLYISNATSTLEIMKMSIPTENSQPKASNTIQVGSSKALRSASVTEIEENKFKLKTYSNEGKTRSVNISKDSNTKHNLIFDYMFNLNQSVDSLRKTVNDFDLIVSSISENKPKVNGTCETLKNQSIPFKSPFCGKELTYTQINQQFSPTHKAIDIVPNQEYAKSNPQYQQNKKEYFYATCDGKLRNYQDKETKANVIEIQCKEKDFIIQYWHDQESFWSWTGEVKAGDVIGIMGESGQSEGGKHLHYIIEKAGVRQDPIQLIKNN
jgi:Peptidase family M23